MLVDCYETIVFENLKPSNMSRRPKPKQDTSDPKPDREAVDANVVLGAGIRRQTGAYLPNGAAAKRGLNKSIVDAGWSTFIGMVCAKAESAGHATVLLVNPKETSQICSGCLNTT